MGVPYRKRRRVPEERHLHPVGCYQALIGGKVQQHQSLMAAQLDQLATDKQTKTVAGIKWRQLSEIVADRWASELIMKCDVIVVLLVQPHKDKVTLWFP